MLHSCCNCNLHGMGVNKLVLDQACTCQLIGHPMTRHSRALAPAAGLITMSTRICHTQTRAYTQTHTHIDACMHANTCAHTLAQWCMLTPACPPHSPSSGACLPISPSLPILCLFQVL